MRWPFRRKRATEPTEPSRRPSREWASLAPLRPVGLRPEPEVAPARAFQARLATRWQQQPMLAPLGHEISLAAPAGLSAGVVAPVQGYPDGPELSLPRLPVGGGELQSPIHYARPLAGAAPVASPVAVPIPSAPAAPVPSSEPPAPQPGTNRTVPVAVPLADAGYPDFPDSSEEPAPLPQDAPLPETPTAPPLPDEPPPRVRRLGRIGAPLHIDAVPPAVLRSPAPAQPESPAGGPARFEPPESTAGGPARFGPLASFEPPASFEHVPVEPPVPFGAPFESPVPEPQIRPVSAPTPGSLGVPDWFGAPAADADPDDPVSVRWSASPQQEPPTPGLPEPTVVTPFAAPAPRVPPMSDPDRPVRPFRRFGVGRPVQSPEEPPHGAPSPEPSPPALPDPAAPADPPPSPPVDFMPLVTPVPEPLVEGPWEFAPALPVPAAERAAGPEPEELAPLVPRLREEPRDAAPPASDDRPLDLPALSRPLASVHRTLAYLPAERMSVLPGLAARPLAEPVPHPASPPAEEAPLAEVGAHVAAALPVPDAPWAGYPPPAPHLDAAQTPDLSALFGVQAAPAEDAPAARAPNAPPAWNAPPALPDYGTEPATTVPDIAGDDPELDQSDERLDGLAADLYDRIRDRLRRELLVDRERSLLLTDWR